MQRNRDITIGFMLLAFSAIVFALAQKLPHEWAGGGLYPATFPRALSIIIGTLSLSLILSGAISKNREKIEPFFGPFVLQMLIFFAAMTGYILLMPLIGYIASTLLFLLIAYLILSEKRGPKQIASGVVFAVIASTAVYAVFAILLKVPVIEGPVDSIIRNLFG